MNRYKILVPLGDHSYSSIFKAENLETHEIVALKIMKKKFYTWQECMSLREIKVLRTLQNPSILRLKEVIRNKDELYLVYEYLEENLFKYYQNLRDKGNTITESQIKNYMNQLISCVNYIHKVGYFHRDLTLENIYIDNQNNIKIGHFNNAREINARPPLTDYISTRWYRAPEQLLRANNYTYKIDIFSMGCIMAELFLMGPLFSGTSEIDQLTKICSLLGTPSHKDWPEFFTLAQKLKIQLPECQQKSFYVFFNNASNEAIDLLQKMLVFNPQKRWNCGELLNHPFFVGGFVTLGSPKNLNRGMSFDKLKFEKKVEEKKEKKKAVSGFEEVVKHVEKKQEEESKNISLGGLKGGLKSVFAKK